MEASTQQDISSSEKIIDKIRARDLSTVLDHYADKIKILSLDCFDTILWRKTATPADAFFNLQEKPTFKSLGITTSIRVSAESRARYKGMLNLTSSEVKLNDIYLEYFPTLTAAQLDVLAAEELAVEMETCYAFPPMVEFMRAAHARGLKIIIVSDTYLTEPQLRNLLTHHLPQDVMAAIDTIFCSCEHGRSKTNGLFENVLKATKQPAETFLHLGDNLTADYISPRALNLFALHFLHEEDCIADLLRLQATTASLLDPNIGSTQPLPNPFGGILAAKEMTANAAETVIGYASLGPIMYAFAQFILAEVAELKRIGKRPKVLFLMRDAYLPHLACDALADEAVGHCIRISRFAAYAASFRTTADIDNYLIDVGTTDRFRDIGRQLQLPDKVLEPILKTLEKSTHPVFEFMKFIHRHDITSIIFKKSADYRARLKKHLEKMIGLTAGDTLVFVDLGYSGTAQRRLGPVFAEEMQIDIVGRYLIALRVPNWEADRRGLLDPSWCDDRAMLSLVLYISLLEQLCTANEKSVIDYDEDGNPIYSEVTLSQQQQKKLTRVQSECMQFIHDAKKFFINPIAPPILRQAAMIELGRMIYFPTELELNYLRSFQAEMNLGTNEVLRIFDPAAGLTGLRRRGLFFMEKSSATMRTNYPAELRTAGIEFALSLITQLRFGLKLQLKDMMLRREVLHIIFMRGNEVYQSPAEALATHDCYYAVWLPAGAADLIYIVFGKNYHWLQIESAEFVKQDAFVSQNETQNTVDATTCLALDQMTDKGGGLFECETQSSAVVAKPELILKDQAKDFIFRLVFRPIAKK